jgi:hypothetical protein
MNKYMNNQGNMLVNKPILLMVALLLALSGLGFTSQPVEAASSSSSYIPTFSILSVVTDDTVTIMTYNFPANDVFDVLMGPMGTQAINGIWVASQSSGNGGTFTATYDIPDALKGSYQIAIRLQSSSGSGYYAYNWFYNNTSAQLPPGSGGPGYGYGGYPTFSIVSVVRDQNVTVQTYNLPPNDSFVVTMGRMGTRGVNGIVVANTDSGAGGSQQFTYDIPSQLYGLYQISIRMESPTSGYFAYNWFYNNTTGVPGGPVPPITPPVVVYPTFSITSVTRDVSVSVQTYNFPANDTYNVYMGPMGTQGIGGILVDTINSGAGGSFPATFSVPAALYGSYQISIRMQSPYTGYYAYNWFYNNTTPY